MVCRRRNPDRRRRVRSQFLHGCRVVVGENVGPALGRIEVGQAKRRDALQPDQLRCFDSAVISDDLVIIADQDRIGEAELPDAAAICRICFLEWVREFRL